MEIKGRNLIEGVPKTITIDDSEIREALSECVATIMNAIRVALERTPPELSADISDRGIVLTGGGALLKNLDKRIREETGLPVSIADDPLASVVLGTGRMLTRFPAAAQDLDRLDGGVGRAMEALLNRYRNITVLLVVIVAQLVLLAYQVKTNQDVRLIRVWAVSAVAPMARLLEAVTGGASGAFSDYFLLVGVHAGEPQAGGRTGPAEDGEPLPPARARNGRAGGGACGCFRRRCLRERLRSASSGRRRASTRRWSLSIGAPLAGVKAGMAVINADGVAGRVSAAYPTSSQVLLITDQSFSAGVVSAKNRVEGILKGLGRSECGVYYIPRDEKVEVGEWFYTSGEDRIFPRGLPVGRVKTVGGDKTFKEIVLVPSGLRAGDGGIAGGSRGRPPVASRGAGDGRQRAAAGAAHCSGGRASAPAAGPAQAAGPGTTADRLLEQYRKRAESRGGAYGDNPESRKPPPAGSPAGPATAPVKPTPTPAAPRPATVKP